MTWTTEVKVIVVPDNNADVRNVPPNILKMLQPNSVLMSNDSLRMYVRASHWESMKDGFRMQELARETEEQPCCK
jgi:hypothetical protein